MENTPKKKSTPTQVVVHTKSKLPITSAADIAWYGQIVSQTKMFGDINPAEGAAIIMMCHQEGWTLYEFVTTFDWMHGRASKKTDAMIADFEARGGKREIVERSSERAAVKLTYNGKTYESALTWEECKKEPFVYAGRQDAILAALKAGDTSRLGIKDKYATPRSRMQMLWARVHSDGIRVICPESVKGNYTPEEVSDFTDDTQQPDNMQPPVAAPVASAPAAAPAPAPAAQQPQAAAPQAATPAVQSSVEFCPAGNPDWVGKRWDDETVFSTDILRQALAVQHPTFTDAMKDYIRSIIAKREAAAQTAQTTTPPAPPMPA